MKYLTEKYWTNFKKDGVLFEKLVNNLLCSIYPNQEFFATKQTHDGGKDIVSEDELLFGENISLWMECKYHKEKISVHDISTTLLMAYLEDAKQLVVFSYSKINKTFLEYMAKYKERTKIDVKVFHDESLEQLIISNINNIDFEEYFPNFIYDVTMSQYEYGDIAFNYKINETNKLKKAETLYLDINEEIKLDFYISNSSSQNVELSFRLIHDELEEYFDVITSPSTTKKHNVDAFSSNVFQYKIRIKKFKNKLKLPKIQVKYNNRQKQLEIQRKYECRWLADTELIGEKYYKILEEAQRYLSVNLGASTISLSGPSGTGKSRILKEINFLSLKLKNKSFIFDTEVKSHTSRQLLKSIISELGSIPEISKIHNKKDIVILSDLKKINSVAYNIMYDNQYDISAHISEIVDYLIELINENSVCIIIDNVQNLDEVSIEMFERLIDKEDYKNNVTFVFSFNTDKLYSSTKPYQFHKKIELLYAQKPKYYYCCTVDGFSNDDAEEYITHCLGCKDEKKVEYQKTIKKIVERIGNNPFYIRNYLLYLYQKNIIVRTEFNKFYILNFKEFNNSFLTLPKSILLLIEERESLFFNSLDNKQSKKYKNFFYFISLFKNIPVEMFYSIFNREMLNRLLDSGFIKYQKDEIVFFHHLYDEFFSQNYVIYEAEDGFIKQLHTYIKKHKLYKKNIFPYMILSYLIDDLNQNVFDIAIDSILTNSIEPYFYKQCFSIISSLIFGDVIKISTTQKVKLYKSIQHKMIYHYGISSFIKYVEVLYSDFLNNFQEYSDDIDKIFPVLKEYIICWLNIGEYHKSLECNKNILEILKNKLIGATKKMYIQLYNCSSMAYHHLDMVDDALKQNDLALKISEEISDNELISTSWRVRGNIYFHSSHAFQYKKEICKCWEKAYQIAFGNEINKNNYNIYFSLSSCMKLVLSRIIDGNLENLDDVIKYISSYFEKTSSLYYEINMRIIKCMYIISKYKNAILINPEKKSEISKLILEAIDYSAVYGNYNYYAYCFYMKALILFSTGRYVESYDNFIAVLNLVNNNYNERTDKIKWQNIVTDILNLLMDSNVELPIQLKYLENKFDINIETNYDDYRSHSVPTMPNGKLGFPKCF